MTPETKQEAERLAEALTIPLGNGKYIATDDIKKGGEMIKQLLEHKPVSSTPYDLMPIKSMAMLSEFMEWFSQWGKTLLIGFVLGLVTAQFYAYDSIIKDCKVMTIFRIGNYSFACKPNFP